MKRIRRIMVVLLLIAAVCITPLKKETKVTIAKTITTANTVNSDLKAPTADANGVTSWDSVYFGRYWQIDTNNDGKADDKDNKTPIQWRVLSVDNDEVLLLADKCLEYRQFHNRTEESVTWENCSLRKWLNNEFYNNAFSADEKNAIVQKTLSNDIDSRYVVECNDTQDNVALLSWDEAFKKDYALTNSKINLETHLTDFVKQKGGTKIGLFTRTSSKQGVVRISNVADNLYEGRYGYTRFSNYISVRPIITIKKASSLWKNAGVIHNFEWDYEESNPVETPSAGNLSIDVPECASSKVAHSGKDGNIVWSIDSNGCLKLEGNGTWKGLGGGYIIGEENMRDMRLPEWLDYTDEIITAKVNVTGMTNCNYLFYGCDNLVKIDISDWDTSSVTNMKAMFAWCQKLQSLDDLETLDTSNVKNMSGMFQGCMGLSQIKFKHFNTENVENMDYMFADCSNAEIADLSNLDTSNLKSMYGIFRYCDLLKSINLSSFDLTKCNSFCINELDNLIEIQTPYNLKNIFDNEDSDSDYIKEDAALPELTSDYTPWKDDSGKAYSRFPINSKSIQLTRKIVHPESFVVFEGVSGDLKWNIDAQGKLTITGSGEAVDKDEKAEEDEEIYPKWHEASKYIKSCVVDVSNITDAERLFADLPYLEKIEFKNFDTSKITNMSYMFYRDYSLKNVDLGAFDTINVETMYKMFSECNSLKNVDLSDFKTNKVCDMEGMFSKCYSLQNLNLQSFDLRQVKYFGGMFEKCFSLQELDLGDSSVDSIGETYGLSGAFECCHNLTKLNLSKWDLKNVADGDDGWESFLKGTVSLSEIKTPINLKAEIKLPQGIWEDALGKTYTVLPKNLSESIVLTKTKDVIITPTPVATPSPSPVIKGTPVPIVKPPVSQNSVSPIVPSVKQARQGNFRRKKVVISSIKNKKGRKIAISWKKTTKAKAYQVAYDTSKKFKNKKTKKVTKTKTTLTKLKIGKTYFIRVRAVTIESGKKVYSKWSKVKKIKVKK